MVTNLFCPGPLDQFGIDDFGPSLLTLHVTSVREVGRYGVPSHARAFGPTDELFQQVVLKVVLLMSFWQQIWPSFSHSFKVKNVSSNKFTSYKDGVFFSVFPLRSRFRGNFAITCDCPLGAFPWERACVRVPAEVRLCLEIGQTRAGFGRGAHTLYPPI